MRLNTFDAEEKNEWVKKGYILPAYDRNQVIEKTKINPVWIHFGGGNLFRSFHTRIAQSLLNSGHINSGIVLIEGYDRELIEKQYRQYDNLSVLLTSDVDGIVKKEVVASVSESYFLDYGDQIELSRIKEIFCNPGLQLASFTITEKGYCLTDEHGFFLNEVVEDFSNGPDNPVSFQGKITALLYERYKNGQYPMALLSTDNCSHNGDKLKSVISAFAHNWCANNFTDSGFESYINDSGLITFPSSMIDKITPGPDKDMMRILKKDGIEDCEITRTGKGVYCAPFVNCEDLEFLVIEDSFPNGRPPFEEAGVMLTDKAKVDQVEKMKVCTCLNPLHTALGIFGILLGYTRISEAMTDLDIKTMIDILGFDEELPAADNPGIIDPRRFLEEVIGIRLVNPFTPDTLQRIVTDTSQKLSIRFGDTLRIYRNNGWNISSLKAIPLVFAGWLRYLLSVDDQGNKYILCDDPMLKRLESVLMNVKLGQKVNSEEVLRDVLKDAKLFGVDLYEIGLAQKVIDDFNFMITGPGAVRTLLHKKAFNC